MTERTHGTITCARRGGDDGKACPCVECRPVLVKWQRARQARYRDRRRRAAAAGAPEAFPFSCDDCGTPLQSIWGLDQHALVCTG